MIKYMKKVLAFVKKHPAYIGAIHAIGGVGVGILIASTLAGAHPVRWGIAFIIVSLIGHLYAWIA